MSEAMRRSWLLVPMSKAERIARAPQWGADVIVLDLVELVAEEDKLAARKKVQGAIPAARAGGAEVFAQIDPELLDADLLACVWPGLSVEWAALCAERNREKTEAVARVKASMAGQALQTRNGRSDGRHDG